MSPTSAACAVPCRSWRRSSGCSERPNPINAQRRPFGSARSSAASSAAAAPVVVGHRVERQRLEQPRLHAGVRVLALHVLAPRRQRRARGLVLAVAELQPREHDGAGQRRLAGAEQRDGLRALAERRAQQRLVRAELLAHRRAHRPVAERVGSGDDDGERGLVLAACREDPGAQQRQHGAQRPLARVGQRVLRARECVLGLINRSDRNAAVESARYAPPAGQVRSQPRSAASAIASRACRSERA